MNAGLDRLIERSLARLPKDRVATLDSTTLAKLRVLLLASDFAADVLRRQPQLLMHLLHDARAPLPPPQLTPDNTAEWGALLRQHRAAESTRLVWRDVVEGASVDEILHGATAQAEQNLRIALSAIEAELALKHGYVRGANGDVQNLVVFGLGKLGGGELNFSSDIDLVFAYPEAGESDGTRALAAEEYFARLGTRLAKLLDETTSEGFVHRVDLRLRPFGGEGRIALSFAAMDAYFQHEGRDWERYAWLKARAVAGDVAAGERWLQSLRPFVYRRYLDFTALDGLRAMKALINAEVERKELDHDIKRGRGGIREIEFFAQSLQLIHGGRDSSLRERRLLPALDALVAARLVSKPVGATLASDYRFLRVLENRLQMLRDAQTHVLPPSELDCARIAASLGYANWNALLRELGQVRARVAGEFSELLATRRKKRDAGALSGYWLALPDAGDARTLRDAGFDSGADSLLRDFAKSHGVRELSAASRARLDRVLPALLAAAAHSRNADAALHRLLQLLRAILRRGSYLALLDEQPQALARLVDVFARSAFLAERLVAFPLLLDELLDARIAGPLPTRKEMHGKCGEVLREADAEQALRQLNEIGLALRFRIAQAELDHRQASIDSARQLAWWAQAVLQTVMDMAKTDMVSAHGKVPGARFAIIGYGSLGAEELGFNSDLDLVFLFDAPSNAQSDGERGIDAAAWHMRLTRKIGTLLGATTSAGHLYEVDARLRPDGSKSGLVTSLASFRDYQRQRAWTWEHQALVRARGVAGDASLIADFDALRGEVLARARDQAELRHDVIDMRRKMRAALDRSDSRLFDLKQGAGGLVDIEFLLQRLVLGHAQAHPSLLPARNTPDLINALHAVGLLDARARATLLSAHALFLIEGLACTLDGRKRVVPRGEAIESATAQVRAVLFAHGLRFD